jgi:rfaE bifunctional protein kinase chain/domain
MKEERLQQILEAARTKRVLVIGDVMLDRFLYGRVSRISPEAPVPVVEVTGEQSYPGGAANVARNLVPFCDHVSICGICGTDTHGRELRGMLEGEGISTECLLETPDFETTVKTRVIARHQQMVRVDREKRLNPNPGLAQQVADLISRCAGQIPFDAVIFEDYAKGFLWQDLVDRIRQVLPPEILVTVDPNPRNKLSWHGVTAIKPNRVEAFQAAGQPDLHEGREPDQDEILQRVGTSLLQEWGAGMLLMTLGEHGMMLFQKDTPPHHTPARAREVFDVSGAGDTAIGIFTLALCGGATAVEAAELANFAGGIVVAKLGTATITPGELTDAVSASRLA